MLWQRSKAIGTASSRLTVIAGERSGQRSGKAVDFLRKAGFRKIKNLKGGILAWSDKVDPSVPKY